MAYIDKKVVLIEPRHEARKGADWLGRKTRVWQIGVVYVLEDGTRQEGSLSYSTRTKARAEYDTLPHEPRNPTTGCYAEDGSFIGTQVVYGLSALGRSW
jgi:hypothetical protein